MALHHHIIYCTDEFISGCNSCTIKWPPRSSDLTLLDFSLPTKVQSDNIEDLKKHDKIIVQQHLTRYFSVSIRNRLGYCQIQSNFRFEQLIKISEVIKSLA